MKLDFNTKQLRYIISGEDYWVATPTNDGKYRAALSLYANGNSVQIM